MAVTKIKPVKGTLNKAIGYILNPEKTDGKMLVSSFACGYETADMEFLLTLDKTEMKKGNNLAHHLIQSFEPGETTPEVAHEIGKRLADSVTDGKYEYVLTTHIDKGHIHNHIMFCAASFIDHHKYVSNRKTYAKIRRTSDELCREYGLSVIVPGQESKGKHYAEYAADKTGGGSWKSKLKMTIDMTMPGATDFEDFLRRMQMQGYEIMRGKYVSFRAPGQERFTRCKTLGIGYTEEAITKRVAGESVRVPRPNRNKTAITLIQQIEDAIAAQQKVGNPYWTKIANLKEAAKTVNFLTENGLLKPADFETKYAEVDAAFADAETALKTAEEKLKGMGILIKHITSYQQTKPAAAGLKNTKDKDAYRSAHESELIIHEAAARAIKSTLPDGGKLPSLATLQVEYDKLSERKDALRSEYSKLKKQAREYGIIKQNMESVLGEPEGKGKAKRRETERN
jgi:hypothetical protein